MAPSPTSEEPVRAGTTQVAGQSVDQGKGRIFPCEQCGADLEFHIGQQSPQCPYCGFAKKIEFAESAAVAEQDYHAMLARLASLRAEHREAVADTLEIRCDSCGSTVTFTGTLTSTECACCGSPIQREHIHTAQDRVPVDGVLPFQVEEPRAQGNLKQWVASRWFAPNDFRQRGIEGKLTGLYMPYWTFDTLTANDYVGERGEHYWVAEGTGQNRRQVRRTRWHPASDSFQQFFDDVLVCAATGLPGSVIQSLEPWSLDNCLPFSQQLLAGFLAQTYAIPLDQGFPQAKGRIDAAIASEVRARIGGDEQRVHSIQTRHHALTYKHLLLPVWIMAYRYQEKSYQVVVNASTGEVQGERPYSWVKITLAILGAAATVATAIFLSKG